MTTGDNWHINPEALLQIPGKVWVFWKDNQSVYLGCNDLMAKTLCLSSRHDILGHTDYDFPFLKTEAEFYCEADRKVILQNRALQFTETASFGKQKIIFQTIKTPLINQNNQVSGILGMSYYIDVTEPHKILLTKRETQILNFLRQGKNAKETIEIGSVVFVPIALDVPEIMERPASELVNMLATRPESSTAIIKAPIQVKMANISLTNPRNKPMRVENRKTIKII